MQSKIRIVLFLLSFIINYDASFAQKRTFGDFNVVQLRNLIPIKHHDEVIGYCMFYYIDDAKEMYKANYKIILLDADLNKVAEKEIVHLLAISLYEVAYNGTHLLLVFLNSRNKLLDYFQYDLKLNEQSKCTVNLTNREVSFQYAGFPFLLISPHIVPFEDGFAMYSFLRKHGKRKYRITYLSNEGKILWVQENAKEEKKKDVLPVFLAANKDIALNVMRSDVVNGFQYKAYNLKTGKNVFLKEILIEGKKTRAMEALVDSVGNFMVGGLFFENRTDSIGEYPQGFFMATIDPTGNLLRHKLYQWADIQKDKIGLDTNGKYKENGSLVIVKMKALPNSHFLLIGECLEAEIGGVFTSHISANDLILLEVDQAFNIINAHVEEKRSNRSSALISRSSLTNISAFEKLASNSSVVDYKDIHTDSKGFSIFYREQKKIDETGKFWKVLSRQYEEQEYLTDRIQLETQADNTDILTAKAGHLLFVEYFEKDRKLNLRLEKFNY
jgi:hypothetical protein